MDSKEKKESNIGGVPLAVIFFVVGIALLVDLPMAYFHYEDRNHQAAMNNRINYLLTQEDLQNHPTPTPTVGITVTPTIPTSQSGAFKSEFIKTSPTPTLRR